MLKYYWGDFKMKKLRNINIKKEKNSMVIKLIIFMVVIVVSFIFILLKAEVVDKTNKEMTDLNSIIISADSKSDKKAYVDVSYTPYQFAVSEETENSYYIIADNNYLYIAYMSPSDFARLNVEGIETSPIRAEGITKVTTEEIKKLAIEAYNEGLEESEKITLDSFNDYFGSVYLDMTIKENSSASFLTLLFIIALVTGVVGIIVILIKLISFNASINRLEQGLAGELDNEMDSQNAFYYKKAHLYLTDNYIINFNGKFVAINYKDVVWMYPYEYRVNGIKSNQSIKIMTNSGKVYTIASMELVTKAKKEVFNEIWNTIASKNSEMVLGYTKENIKLMNDTYRNKKGKKRI